MINLCRGVALGHQQQRSGKSKKGSSLQGLQLLVLLALVVTAATKEVKSLTSTFRSLSSTCFITRNLQTTVSSNLTKNGKSCYSVKTSAFARSKIMLSRPALNLGRMFMSKHPPANTDQNTSDFWLQQKELADSIKSEEESFRK